MSVFGICLSLEENKFLFWLGMHACIEAGFAKVVGVKKNEILEEIECTLNKKEELPLFSPFGDGAAGKKIVEILIKEVFDTETYKR